MREIYAEQVRLLIDVLPAVVEEKDFAIKGGTAINLFHRDLPRLSVDIDLTFLPVMERRDSLRRIDAAMDRIAMNGAGGQIKSDRIPGGGGAATRILFQRGRARVKVETSPVIRGVAFEPNLRRVTPAVEEAFGFAQAQVVSFEDLYAGKLVAALDRQHPRDLFDVKLLYENEGLTDDLFRVFLVYVASSSRPPHELLDPRLKPLQDIHEMEFAGMTAEPVDHLELETIRAKLINDVCGRLTGPAAQFMRGLAQGNPDFEIIGLPAAANLPAIRWKLENVQTLRAADPKKLNEQAAALEALLRD